MNSDVYWDYSQKIVRALAGALGKHPQLIAWQIDNGIGGHNTEASFNEETRRDWHAWLQGQIRNHRAAQRHDGTPFLGADRHRFEDVPMPMNAPTVHNPALVLDWMRFCSDTIVAYARMQADCCTN